MFTRSCCQDAWQDENKLPKELKSLERGRGKLSLEIAGLKKYASTVDKSFP